MNTSDPKTCNRPVLLCPRVFLAHLSSRGRRVGGEEDAQGCPSWHGCSSWRGSNIKPGGGQKYNNHGKNGSKELMMMFFF